MQLPEGPSLVEQIPRLVQITALGTHEMYSKYREYIRLRRAFYAQVASCQRIRAQERRTAGTGTQELDALQLVQKAREALVSLHEEIGDLARRELAKP